MQNPEQVRVKRAGSTPSRIIEGEALIVQTREGMVNVLNPVGTRIWEWCDGSLSIAEMGERLCGEYGLEPAAALADAVEFLEDMREKGLVEFLPPADAPCPAPGG